MPLHCHAFDIDDISTLMRQFDTLSPAAIIITFSFMMPAFVSPTFSPLLLISFRRYYFRHYCHFISHFSHIAIAEPARCAVLAKRAIFAFRLQALLCYCFISLALILMLLAFVIFIFAFRR
jgi:hypothetical protein